MGHYLTPPELDPRPVEASAKGVLAPGHTRGVAACSACLRAEAEAAEREAAERAARAAARRVQRKRPAVSSRFGARVTVTDAVLYAAWALTCDGEPVTTSALVLRAWQLAPQVCGLLGHREEHPCSRTITAAASKLVARGWLVSVGVSTWKVTAPGELRARLVGGRS